MPPTCSPLLEGNFSLLEHLLSVFLLTTSLANGSQDSPFSLRLCGISHRIESRTLRHPSRLCLQSSIDDWTLQNRPASILRLPEPLCCLSLSFIFPVPPSLSEGHPSPNAVSTVSVHRSDHLFRNCILDYPSVYIVITGPSTPIIHIHGLQVLQRWRHQATGVPADVDRDNNDGFN